MFKPPAVSVERLFFLFSFKRDSFYLQRCIEKCTFSVACSNWNDTYWASGRYIVSIKATSFLNYTYGDTGYINGSRHTADEYLFIIMHDADDANSLSWTWGWQTPCVWLHPLVTLEHSTVHVCFYCWQLFCLEFNDPVTTFSRHKQTCREEECVAEP